MIAGFVNTFLLKPKIKMEKSKARIWIVSCHTKLILSILFLTPISKIIISNPHILEVFFF